jgi:hypothetical protein
MADNNDPAPPDEIFVEFQGRTLQLMDGADSRCRAMQLPEGLLLRYILAKTLYFYLRTRSKDANLSTQIYATDSPYDPCKTEISEVLTPMFDEGADEIHLKKVQQVLRSWVHFVREQTDGDEEDFVAFPLQMGSSVGRRHDRER